MPPAYFGYAATLFSVTIFFPQVIKAWKSKHTKDLSLLTWILTTIAISFWLIYGLLIRDWPVIITNTTNLTMSLFVLYLKKKYG